MRILNVITVHAGIIKEITSFVMVDKDPNESAIILAAENLFIEKVKQVAPEATEEELNDYLDDGVYAAEGGNYEEVNLVWSEKVVP